jgi:hypothetical protein
VPLGVPDAALFGCGEAQPSRNVMTIVMSAIWILFIVQSLV